MTEALAEKKCVPCRDVRFGSKADIAGCPNDVRFTPKSGHVQCTRQRLLCANSGHSQPSNTHSKTASQRSPKLQKVF